MSIKLIRVGIEEAELIWKMQVESFMSLYEKYQDTETSPATEKIDKVIWRLEQPNTYFYKIMAEDTCVGAIRIIDDKNENIRKRISPLFILPSFRGKGYAKRAIMEAEKIHGDSNWFLDTILQEEGNCALYEKMGYKATGKTEVVNERMTLVDYIK